MRTIWKFPLTASTVQVVKMPKGAKILSVHLQRGTPCIWALVDWELGEPEAAHVDRLVYLYGTGDLFELPEVAEFVGTFMTEDGRYVFHVFDGGE